MKIHHKAESNAPEASDSSVDAQPLQTPDTQALPTGADAQMPNAGPADAGGVQPADPSADPTMDLSAGAPDAQPTDPTADAGMGAQEGQPTDDMAPDEGNDMGNGDDVEAEDTPKVDTTELDKKYSQLSKPNQVAADKYIDSMLDNQKEDDAETEEIEGKDNTDDMEEAPSQEGADAGQPMAPSPDQTQQQPMMERFIFTKKQLRQLNEMRRLMK